MNTGMTLTFLILLSILLVASGFAIGLSLFALPYFAALQPSYPELDSIRVPMWRLTLHVWKTYSALANGNWPRYLELEKNLVQEFGRRYTNRNRDRGGECRLTAGEVEEMARKGRWDHGSD